jgi:hypothetical protein
LGGSSGASLPLNLSSPSRQQFALAQTPIFRIEKTAAFAAAPSPLSVAQPTRQ